MAIGSVMNVLAATFVSYYVLTFVVLGTGG
jgi:hypothetical protein